MLQRKKIRNVEDYATSLLQAKEQLRIAKEKQDQFKVKIEDSIEKEMLDYFKEGQKRKMILKLKKKR